ncbi:pantetheine-phosphate adenylyltransferase, partial [Mycobacterium tuberculosis]|nr:pantetheine-phosphate adenylyltransferase [Mycobacterium tuberculosis]
MTSLVRGLRNSQDFLYESNMDYFNHQLAPELETIYLCAPPQYQALSSTRIRELLTFQQAVSAYVPESVIK